MSVCRFAQLIFVDKFNGSTPKNQRAIGASCFTNASVVNINELVWVKTLEQRFVEDY